MELTIEQRLDCLIDTLNTLVNENNARAQKYKGVAINEYYYKGRADAEESILAIIKMIRHNN